MRIALVASARFPIREPFAGGLEAHSWTLAFGLRARGHDVTVFAGTGSDPELNARELGGRHLQVSELARADVSMTPDWWLQEHHAYLTLMLELSRSDFDIVHNNSLHYLPVAMASMLSTPVVTTLHTPPTPWLESAIRAPSECPVTFVAVSSHTTAAWRHRAPGIGVIPNGVDLRQWPMGAGGDEAVWFGRLVPEKAPHLAIEAARRAGFRLRLVGPILDPAYFADRVEPWLGDDVTYVGHLVRSELAAIVGQSAVCVVTPDWDEPYGLVVAEALACGTPVAAFARGGVPELVDATCARLAPGGDVPALADAIGAAARLERRAARRRAVEHCSVDAMLDRYERLYLNVTEPAAA